MAKSQPLAFLLAASYLVLYAPLRVAAQGLQADESSSSSCGMDTQKILSTPRVDDAAKNFLRSFSSECTQNLNDQLQTTQSDSDSILCERPVYKARNLRRSITRVMDYTALEETDTTGTGAGTLEFTDLYNACLADNFVPVRIDDQVRFKDIYNVDNTSNQRMDRRVLGNGLLHCLPPECATTYTNMRDAYFAFVGQEVADATERLDFHRDTAPYTFDTTTTTSNTTEAEELDLDAILDASSTSSNVTSRSVSRADVTNTTANHSDSTTSTCDAQSAGWARWSPALRTAYNHYISRINEDCNPSQQQDYCKVLYRSLGEHTEQSYKMYNHFESSTLTAYSQACNDAGGELCAFDMTITYEASKQLQNSASAWWREDRGSVNYQFLGYPDCYAKSCSYEQMKTNTERAHLKNLFDKLTDNLRPKSRGNRVLHKDEQTETLENEDEDPSNHDNNDQEWDEDTTTIPASTTAKRRTLSLPSSSSFRGATNRNLESLESMDLDNPPQIELRATSTDLDIDIDSIEDILDDYDEAIPEASFIDDLINSSSQSLQSQFPRTNTSVSRAAHNVYQGEDKCGPAASQCYTRLSNFCLRPTTV
jgi:hypothetical protein